jgi:hypothetical protein
VHLAKQAVAGRETLPETGHAVLQRGDIVGDFHHVIKRRSRYFFEFEEQQVGKGRLSALNLGREHGLASDIGVEEQLRVREQGADAVEPPNVVRGALQESLPLARKLQRWHRGQRERNESPHHFASNDRDAIGSAGRALHGASLNNGSGY